MLLYYITDRRLLGDSEEARRARLLETIAEAARAGVDYVQLREKDLSGRELEQLAGQAVEAIGSQPGRRTRLLINARCDVAIATGAAGVHLPSRDLAANEARAVFTSAGVRTAVIGVSCHTIAEAQFAASRGADFVTFGPVFSKRGAAPAGLDALRAVCSAFAPAEPAAEAAARFRVPVLALGGVKLENARACAEAGAAGVAAIRLFQQDDVAAVVRALRDIPAPRP